MILLKPDAAWRQYLRVVATQDNWFQKSGDISTELPVSNRELFGMILYAYMHNHLEKNDSWQVGYDHIAPEPNDGFITDGTTRINVEHKLLASMDQREVIQGILGTYDKYAAKGPAYGQGRTLLLHANKQTEGSVRISSLTDHIANKCPFDRVILITLLCNKDEGRTGCFFLTEHYPGNSTRQVNFDYHEGQGINPYYAEQ